MTTAEIIDDTVTYYGEPSRRSQGPYVYQGRLGPVGRYMHNVVQFEAMSCLPSRIGRSLNSLLQDDCTGHPLEFWDDLSALHDDAQNWSDQGLTPKGEATVQRLKQAYAV